MLEKMSFPVSVTGSRASCRAMMCAGGSIDVARNRYEGELEQWHMHMHMHRQGKLIMPNSSQQVSTQGKAGGNLAVKLESTV
jgi:hypothetical protein